MHAKLKYWAGDHMSYLDALYALLKKCKAKGRLAKGDDTILAMWQERGARICLIIASQLMEMKVVPSKHYSKFTNLTQMKRISQQQLDYWSRYVKRGLNIPPNSDRQ